MTRLIRVELSRLAARRLTRVLAALFLLILMIVLVRQAVVSDRDVDAARAKARAEAAEFAAQFPEEELAGHLKECNAAKARGELPPEVDCAQEARPPTEENFYNDPRFSFSQELRGGTQGIGFFMAMIGFLVGASFIGAEWHFGTLQALLLWEPRRIRVILAKAAALVAGLVVFTVAVELLFTGGSYLIAATRGTTEGTTAGLVTSCALGVLRALYVIAFTGLLGFAISGLSRVTAAALGTGFAYFAIFENLIRGLRPGWSRYLVGENIIAVVEKGVDITRGGQEAVSSIAGEGASNVFRLSGQRGALTLAVYLAILLGVFVVTFQRRDVT